MTATILAFPAHRVAATTTRPSGAGESAGAHIDTILSTKLSRIQPRGFPGYGAQRSQAIRALFRELGWAKFFRVRKGGYTLGTDIDWADGYRPTWDCEAVHAKKVERGNSPTWFAIPVCLCDTCKRRQSQRDAISRRVHHALNLAFRSSESSDRAFGNRSDYQSDYFDADYTFHA